MTASIQPPKFIGARKIFLKIFNFFEKVFEIFLKKSPVQFAFILAVQIKNSFYFFACASN